MDKICEIWPNWHEVELLGKGSFGSVYKAKREHMGNISYSAVKIIHIPQEESEVRELYNSGMDVQSIRVYYEDMIKNLMNEIQLMEKLKSANNIVSIEDYEVIEKDTIGWDIYIRMELLSSFQEYNEKKNLGKEDILKIALDICQALSFCHSEQIIHRDIKVDNIFVNSFGEWKLGDFGISKQLEKTMSALSQKGTNMYMAPEVYRGERYTYNADIYSLGIMLYRLFNNGRFPYMPQYPEPIRFDDMEKAMKRRLAGEQMLPPSMTDEKLATIIFKACQYNPAERYQTAGDMRRDLLRYMENKDVQINHQEQKIEKEKPIAKEKREEKRIEWTDQNYKTERVNFGGDAQAYYEKASEAQKYDENVWLENIITRCREYGIDFRIPKNVNYMAPFKDTTLEANLRINLIRQSKILVGYGTDFVFSFMVRYDRNNENGIEFIKDSFIQKKRNEIGMVLENHLYHCKGEAFIYLMACEHQNSQKKTHILACAWNHLQYEFQITGNLGHKEILFAVMKTITINRQLTLTKDSIFMLLKPYLLQMSTKKHKIVYFKGSIPQEVYAAYLSGFGKKNVPALYDIEAIVPFSPLGAVMGQHGCIFTKEKLVIKEDIILVYTIPYQAITSVDKKRKKLIIHATNRDFKIGVSINLDALYEFLRNIIITIHL